MAATTSVALNNEINSYLTALNLIQAVFSCIQGTSYGKEHHTAHRKTAEILEFYTLQNS